MLPSLVVSATLLLPAAPCSLQDAAVPRTAWQPLSESDVDAHLDRWRTLTGPLRALVEVELVLAEESELDSRDALEGLRTQFAEQLDPARGAFDIPAIVASTDALLTDLPPESGARFTRTLVPMTVYQGDGFEARVDHRAPHEAVLVSAVRTREVMVLHNQYPEGVGEQLSLKDPEASPHMLTLRDVASPVPATEHERSVLRASTWTQLPLGPDRSALCSVRGSDSGPDAIRLYVVDTRHGLPLLAAVFPWGPGEGPQVVTSISYRAGADGLLQPDRLVQSFASGASIQIASMVVESVEWGSHTRDEFEIAPGEFAVLYDDRAGSRKYFGWADKLGWPTPIHAFLEMSPEVARPSAAVNWVAPGIPFAGNRDEHGHPVGPLAEQALAIAAPGPPEPGSSRRLPLLLGVLLTCGGLAFATRSTSAPQGGGAR